MRTLLITNSYDATSDLLIAKMGTEKFIRLNFDRPRDWSIKLTPTDIEIVSDHGIFSNKDITKCVWRKPFISNPDDETFQDVFVLEEWKYSLFEIALLMQDQGKLRMNFPIADYELGKVKQLRYAKDFFNVSETVFYSNSQPVTDLKPSIVKSLSGKPLSDGKVLYTVDVSGKHLTSDVWLVQDKVDARFDLTVVYLYGEIFCFRLDRSKLQDIDWRKEQFEVVKDWEMVDLGPDFSEAINGFMRKLNLVYGRLDFLLPNVGLPPIFLEVNKNGQWAWLDATFNNGLFAAMCRVFDPQESC